MLLPMELGLNLLWLLLAVASFALVGRSTCNRTLSYWHSLRRMLALTCALVIFFPVISLTDDLHAAQVVMEDSNPSKRILKSSGAPGAAPNLERSSLPFLAIPVGLLAGQSPALLGLMAIHEACLLVATPVERPAPRAPPALGFHS